MRLPITPQISTKDGVSAKNARLTNCLKESKKTGDKAVIRPGLVLDVQASGVGNGLVVFNGELVSVYGATLGLTPELAAASGTSAPYGLGSGGLETQRAVFLGGTTWLICGLEYNFEYSEVYTGNGNGSMALDMSGFSTGNDIFASASSGTSVVLGTANGSGYGGAAELWYSALGGALSFSVKNAGGGSQAPHGVRYANSTYVICYTLAATNAVVARSLDDGVTWSSTTLDQSGARDAAWDGSQWIIGGWDNSGGTVNWLKSTTDLITFSPVTTTGLPSTFQILHLVYGSGTYYISGTGAGGAEMWESPNYTDWTQVSGAWGDVCSSAEGDVFAVKTNGEVYQAVAGVMTLIDVSPAPLVMTNIASNDDGTVIVGCRQISGYQRVELTAAETTIPALATVTGDYFDFAQSPL